LAALTSAVCAVLVAGCGSSQSGVSHDAVRPGDPKYALTQLRSESTGDELQPANLRKALPNYQYRVGNAAKVVSFSDAVVVGTVTHVREGNGVIWRDDQDFTVVDYTDAKADTRSALVTMTVDEATGAIDPSSRPVTFRVIAPAQADPERFIEGLAGLQRIAVVLRNDPNAAETTPWRPILGDHLICVIASDGSLTLPAFPDATAFQGTIQTEKALTEAATVPALTEQMPRP